MTETGLGRWEAALGEEVAGEAIEALRSTAGFADALRHSVLRPLELLDADPLFHRAISDGGRLVLGVLAFYLDATGGLTHRRLRSLAGGTGVFSSGRATAILMHLRAIRYVEPAAEHRPGTQRLYSPTPALTAAFHKRFTIELQSIALFEPAMQPFLQAFERPEVFRTFMGFVGQLGLEGLAAPQKPQIAVFNTLTARTAGSLIVFALLEAGDLGGPFPPTGRAPVNVARLAQRLGVSRPHILRVLREAEEAGYVRREGAGDVTLLPPLRETFERYYAITYIGFIVAAHRTLLAMPELTAQTQTS